MPPDRSPVSPGPLPPATAWRAVGRCVLTTLPMLVDRRVRLARDRVGTTIRFADGSTGEVYRETRIGAGIAAGGPTDPCVLVVGFRLRGVRGHGHTAFEVESLLNTPLFAGFPGLVSKLWLRHDEHGVYRGLYEWDGPELAEAYARSLWRVLALVSVPGSIGYRVLAGLRRDALLAEPWRLAGFAPFESDAWWRVVGVTPPPPTIGPWAHHETS